VAHYQESSLVLVEICVSEFKEDLKNCLLSRVLDLGHPLLISLSSFGILINWLYLLVRTLAIFVICRYWCGNIDDAVGFLSERLILAITKLEGEEMSVRDHGSGDFDNKRDSLLSSFSLAIENLKNPFIESLRHIDDLESLERPRFLAIVDKLEPQL
jgi:hypothetical protein